MLYITFFGLYCVCSTQSASSAYLGSISAKSTMLANECVSEYCHALVGEEVSIQWILQVVKLRYPASRFSAYKDFCRHV